VSQYIKSPLNSDDWDPSKGDFISKGIIKEEKQYKWKALKKKAYISFLAFLHLLLLISFLILSKS
jgi:hypothetical protein